MRNLRISPAKAPFVAGTVSAFDKSAQPLNVCVEPTSMNANMASEREPTTEAESPKTCNAVLQLSHRPIRLTCAVGSIAAQYSHRVGDAIANPHERRIVNHKFVFVQLAVTTEVPWLRHYLPFAE